MPTTPVRPTVFYFCRLGDMIMLTPLLRRLHLRYGLPCNVVGSGSWTPSVYNGNPDVAATWAFGRHLPFLLDPTWTHVRRALRDSHPGPIYICESHYRQLPRIRRMLALSAVNPARCVFISDGQAGGPEHLVDRLMRFGERTPPGLREADYPVPPARHVDGPSLYVLDSERADRRRWMHSLGFPDSPYVLVQPGNHRSMGPRRDRWRRLNTDDKAWPLERWVSLVQRVYEQIPQTPIVLRGSTEEVPMLNEIQAASGLQGVIVAGTGLRPLFALCESAHSVISVDTGPAHAAAALGVPLVVLYGAESPRYWLPRTPTGSPVIGVGGPPTSVRADQVSVDAMFDSWRSLVEQAYPTTAVESVSADIVR